MTKRHCRIKLVPDFANLSVLEYFIYNNSCLSPHEKLRALLITTEYFDNIISHSKGTRPCKVSVLISVSKRKKIIMRYHTNNFSEMVTANRITEPYYDLESKRYRGLGLRMCRNLASSITFHKGLFKSSIIIILY
ncbi:MAG TPA: hypothetical protein VJ861_04600 [Treponemataceae bacterium]|nr:hypothetical protein [Treponemataceae bacterium]